ncbi:2-iminoacetate synthase ThiH [soil metagenome]
MSAAAVHSRAVTFRDELDALDLPGLAEHARTATATDVDAALARSDGHRDLTDAAALLSDAASNRLEDLAQAAHELTVRRFGRTVHLFAPLYVSNECLSTCTYCGFAKNLEIRRRTLLLPEVQREAGLLTQQGFRHLLLVSGEHIKAVSPAYLASCIDLLQGEVPSISIETQVWDADDYALLAEAGCDGVVIYQETYDHDTYRAVHVAGMKRHEDFRLAGPERAADAGMRRLGIGALLGLHHDWRAEALAALAHARYLIRRFWRTEVTVSFPRMRPSASGFQPANPVGDRDFAQLTCAARLAVPDVGIVLSTREEPALRDGLVGLGVTHASAGSHTEPGGYAEPEQAQEQFAISDHRSPAAFAAMLRARGYDPVWKDWSAALSLAELERL